MTVRRWPVATVLLLAACGDGAPAATGSTPSPGPLFPASSVTGPTSTTGPDGAGGLAAPDGQRLDRALNSTDLSLSAEEASAGIELVVVNLGPNPADDVWVELTTVPPVEPLPVEPPPTAGCRAEPAGLSCPLGPLAAREEARLPLTIETGAAVTAEVGDRAGSDPAPDDNQVRLVGHSLQPDATREPCVFESDAESGRRASEQSARLAGEP